MVLQMREVVRRQFLQRHQWIVSDPARRGALRFRHCCQYMGQESIVGRPEPEQVAPPRILISLYPHAAGLIVTWPAQLILKLRANEALMVVRRRIDQVPQNLLARPAAFNRWNGSLRLANSSKIAFAAYNQLFQPSTQLNHGF